MIDWSQLPALIAGVSMMVICYLGACTMTWLFDEDDEKRFFQ